MTRDEEVAEYLKNRVDEAFCDDFIAKSVNINRFQAANATRPLGTTRDFVREKNLLEMFEIKEGHKSD